jgi:cupin fold WbuC family metalloprotein
MPCIPTDGFDCTAMKVFTRALIDQLAVQATASPRKRTHHNLHASPEDRVQRFFVCADRDTYFRPHRHLTKSELAVVLQGRFDVVLFDASGRILDRWAVGEGTPGFAYETPSATWHTLIAQTDGATFLEIKEGPYDPKTATEFAAWAPPEGDAAAGAYLEWLRTAQPESTSSSRADTIPNARDS